MVREAKLLYSGTPSGLGLHFCDHIRVDCTEGRFALLSITQVGRALP